METLSRDATIQVKSTEHTKNALMRLASLAGMSLSSYADDLFLREIGRLHHLIQDSEIVEGESKRK